MKTRLHHILALAGVVCSSMAVSGAEATPSRIAGNPYLPLWEHLPDGEPRLFEDPDNPGKYRIYIIGSHDTQMTRYCGFDIHQWSAPVEDLNNWRDEGPIFSFATPEGHDVFFAPDLVEVPQKDGTKAYYLLPHDCAGQRMRVIARSDRPDGPFVPVNMDSTTCAALPGGVFGFDPAIYVEAVTDPADPDYATGYKAWGYWGFTESSAARLDPNLWALHPEGEIVKPFIPATNPDGSLKDPAGSVYTAIAEGERPEDFGFFEASSIRKVGNKYVMIYSGRSGKEYGVGHSNSTLRYAYADSPMGPWRNGGVLVDSRGIVLSENGDKLEGRNYGHNTHGSIECINGQWYVFYHRPPRGFGFARQAMVAPIAIENDNLAVADGGRMKIRAYDPYKGTWEARATDGSVYDGAEVTSEGFNIYGLPPYNFYPAGYACYLTNGQGMKDNYDVWDDGMAVEMKSGDVIGFKYFGFGGLDSAKNGLKPFEGTRAGNGTSFSLVLTPSSEAPVTVDVWLDGPWDNATWKGTKIGEITIDPSASGPGEKVYTLDVSGAVDPLDGKHAIYLRANGAGDAPLFTLRGLGFAKKGEPLAVPTVPTVGISVDGRALDIPSAPVATTPQNGYKSNTHYHLRAAVSDKAHTPEIVPTASDKSVKFEIEHPSKEEALVKATYQGATKTYHIALD